jgi:hypothetical protein
VAEGGIAVKRLSLFALAVVALAVLASVSCASARWEPASVDGVVGAGGRAAPHWQPIGADAVRWTEEAWYLLVLTAERGVVRVPSTPEVVTTIARGLCVVVNGEKRGDRFRGVDVRARVCSQTAKPPPGMSS